MAASEEEFLQRLRAAFMVEADEHCRALSKGLGELELNPPEERRAVVIGEIFRSAHSLKGAARAVNAPEIEAVCQAMENVFADWRRDPKQPAPAYFETLHRAVDLVADLLVAPEGKAAVVNDVASQLASIHQAVRAAESHGQEKVQEAPAASQGPVAVEAERAVPAPEPSLPVRLPGDSGTVRIAAAKLDAVLLQAEEMLLLKQASEERLAELRLLAVELSGLRREWQHAATRQQRSADPAGDDGAAMPSDARSMHLFKQAESRLSALLQQSEAESRQLATALGGLVRDAKQLVMLPFATISEGFPRLVRELARDQGKSIRFVSRGEDTEVDKRLLEALKDPLIHLLRNCVDHGVEPPAERGEKPAQATVELSVSQSGGNELTLRVSDDGRGIDLERVKQAARERGVASAEEIERMSASEAMELIFRADLSTRRKVTEISGRGLGLAIVWEAIHRLGGTIAVRSQRGRGTAFHIALPLSVATAEGLLVGSGGQIFAIPLNHIERVVRLPLAQVEAVHGRDTIVVDGCVTPAVRLSDALGIRASVPPALPAGAASPMLVAVVLGAGEDKAALLVDEIRASMEVLIKPLGPMLGELRFVSGVTILPDGNPSLVLHGLDLARAARTAGTGAAGGDHAAHEEGAPPHVLIAEDSITSRTLLKSIIESAGCRVTTAVDGADALRALRSGTFHLVVSDVDMPRLDGFGLTSAIRADPSLASLPVLLVTGREEKEDRRRGEECGANAYIVKSSFDEGDLLNTIRSFI